MPGGRPTDYSAETADAICERLADGESLRAICATEEMPAKGTVCRWLAEHEEFQDQYRRAREAQADTLFDEMLDIADDGLNDWMARKNREGDIVGWRENGEAIRRSQLRVDTRKWVIGRLQPKKYGDRVTNVLEGGDKPVEVAGADPRDLAKAMALIMAKGLKSADGSGD